MIRSVRLTLTVATMLVFWGVAVCGCAQQSQNQNWSQSGSEGRASGSRGLSIGSGAQSSGRIDSEGKRNIERVESDSLKSDLRGWKLFLVGTNRYYNLSIDDQLQYAENDVESLRDRFVELGVPEENATCLTSDQVGQFSTTRRNIVREFNNFVNSLRSDDAAFVYLSGHGFRFDENRKSYYAPSDLDAESAESIKETGVSIDEINERLDKSPARFKWAIVDACRNDPTKPTRRAFQLRSAGIQERFVVDTDDLPEDSFCFMQSCKNGQFSLESNVKGHGLFTCALLEALQTEDNPIDLVKNEDAVYFNDLIDFVQRRTNELAKEFERVQVPYVSNRNVPRFVFFSGLRQDGLTLAEREALDDVERLIDRKEFEDARKAFDDLDQRLKDIDRGKNLAQRLAMEDVAHKAEQDYAAAERALDDFDFSGAREAIGRALKAFPDNDKYKRLLTRIDREQKREAEIAYNNAVISKLNGDVPSAKEKIEEAIKLATDEKSKAQYQKFRDDLGKPATNSQQVVQTQGTPNQPQQSASSGSSSSGTRKAGERLVVPIKGVEVAFRWCPPGTFMMGLPESEENRYDREAQHDVTLTKGFWMAETETTQELWGKVMKNNPSSFAGNSQLPVETVRWEEVQGFIKTVNDLEVISKGEFRLPTEAEWEYACRAGTTTPFSFGSTLNGDKANCNGNYPYGTSTKGKYLEKTTPVKSYPANAWGLYDMHGNVWEWCSDWYGDYPDGPATDPTGSSSGSLRVVRGGGWNYGARDCRSAIRLGCGPAYGCRSLGFRLLMTDVQ